MKAGTQRVMHCPCGQPKVLARGLCATGYTLQRQDGAYFGGHREEVLKRDGYRYRVLGCTTLKRGKQSVAVHQGAQIPYHLNRAMDNGLTQEQAAEVLTHMAFYSGWPTVFSALPVFKEVFAARNK